MVLLLSFFSTGLLAKTYPVEQTRIEQFFPGVVISKATGPYPGRDRTLLMKFEQADRL